MKQWQKMECLIKTKNKMATKKTNGSEFVKTLRYHGISKRMLGEAMQLSQPTIKNYCENPQRFRLEQLKTIGMLTGMGLEQIDEVISNEETKK